MPAVYIKTNGFNEHIKEILNAMPEQAKKSMEYIEEN